MNVSGNLKLWLIPFASRAAHKAGAQDKAAPDLLLATPATPEVIQKALHADGYGGPAAVNPTRDGRAPQGHGRW